MDDLPQLCPGAGATPEAVRGGGGDWVSTIPVIYTMFKKKTP